jgi:chromosome segregation ATPase
MEFSEAAQAASNGIARTTTDLTRVLTNEIDRIVKETFRMTQKIRKIDERLREWDEVLADMEDMLLDVRQGRQEASSQKGEAKSDFWRLEQDVEQEIKYSEKRRQELEDKINSEILKMQDTSRRLKQRLKKIKL